MKQPRDQLTLFLRMILCKNVQFNNTFAHIWTKLFIFYIL